MRDQPELDLAWLEPRFAIGARPDPPLREPTHRLGIDAIVALHTPDPDEPGRWAALGVDFSAFPTMDWVEIPPERFGVVVARVLQHQRAGRSVLLHCIAGVNRAPTFAAAVLSWRDGLTADQALARVRMARPIVAPTFEQIASLRAWVERPRFPDGLHPGTTRDGPRIG